jgi:hypothetical protein
MNKCPLCKCSYAKKSHCAIRLFNSENECAVCMENKSEMLALPCGHQFCQEDLATLGIFPVKKKTKKTKKRKRPAAPTARSWAGAVARATASSSRSVARRRLGNVVPVFRRCGWCGHHGHNIRKCEEHRLQCRSNCGTTTIGTAMHKEIHRNKVNCQTCHKKGHESVMCAVVILA